MFLTNKLVILSQSALLAALFVIPVSAQNYDFSISHHTTRTTNTCKEYTGCCKNYTGCGSQRLRRVRRVHFY